MKLKAALLSALLLVFSFPVVIAGVHFPHSSFLAWVGWVPFFLILPDQSLKGSFKWGFLTFAIFYSGSMFWLYTAMNEFGHLSPLLSVFVLLLLIAILSLYTALIFPITLYLERRFCLPSFFGLPLVWVIVEWARTFWPLGGFPWGQLGYSQSNHPLVIQISNVTGVYGVTAWVVWINLSVATLLRRSDSKRLPKILFGFILFLFVLVYGQHSSQKTEEEMSHAPQVRVGLLQGNISQDEKWLSEKRSEILTIYQSLTHLATVGGAEIVLWPEASFPYDLNLSDSLTLESIGDFKTDVVIGSITESHSFFYNTALLLRPGGKLAGFYHKQHLVPYGEYIPLKDLLPFLGKVTDQIGEFLPGTDFFLLNSGLAQMGSLICYEDLFPEVARGHVSRGANLLINLSNDAWYGDSSALEQHLAFSVFRAVETRRFLLRATNTGVSATIDPLGKIRHVLPSGTRDILLDEVGLLTSQTFYVRWGDGFPKVCLLFLIFGMTAGMCRKILF